ncbi:P-loop containing nucleoside triphosphate hydrolase protein [Armillaria fumosa]|nr:P-loop containing nucleoside triphosphate hydrolase protein [Armillaria fumosa]
MSTPDNFSVPSSSSSTTSDDDDYADGVGLADRELSQTRRRLLDLMNRMSNTGAQKDIDLPQIAVIGQQSAGKSSLIESISGITLPRASGTCTRCPTECRLLYSSAPWKCVVSLRMADAHGKLDMKQFGEAIYDKSQVEERLRRAQRAILNPKEPMGDFLVGADKDLLKNQLTFSSDCVSLQISGPDVADLSFCDLPGLIASVSTGGNQNDIKLVESLVESYITKPSCVILLTVACETDFENQGAYSLAKKHDPKGKRTIGVLTKPDRIASGDEDRWIAFIRNEREPLENNWYCVKQPSSVELGQRITWQQAREKERNWFRTTAPWKDLETFYKGYLQTANLVARLSSILSDLIAKRLPDIQKELDAAIQDTAQKIATLPKAPSSNSLHEISALLHSFTVDLATHIQGIPDEDGIIQTIRPEQEKFQREIRSTAPDFRPFERKHAGKRHLEWPDFLSNDDGEEDEPEELCEGSRYLPDDKNTIYIDELWTRALHARTRELPGNFPFIVKASFIYTFIEKWHKPAKALCHAVHRLLSQHAAKLVTRHFSTYGQGALEQRIQVYAQDYLKKQLERTEEKVDWLFSLEDLPFTLNTHYLADYNAKFFAYYKGARQRASSGDVMSKLQGFQNGVRTNSMQYTTNSITNAISALSAIGIEGIKANDLAKLLPPDQMEPALSIMAEVRAYFQVAYKRFTDIIPLAIDHDLVRGLNRDLLETLSDRLGIYRPEGQELCERLAQENPQVSEKRKELEKKMERLRSASNELLNVRF